jgi:ParB-like chromosome segregation protein Spo0J
MTAIFKFPDYEQHPVAISLMPGGMDDTEFEAFAEDIESKGVLMPVTLYEGRVLDGWHRYRAAKRYGIAFQTKVYEGKDPAGYIASVNVLRRKLGSLQRALVASRMHRDHGRTQREACKQLGISNEVLTLVLRAIDSKNAKLIKRIEDDTDFTRGLLREELEDAGLMRVKEKAAAPAAPNSVFDTRSMISMNAANSGLDDILGGDTIGTDDPVPDTGKKRSHPERKARDSAAQLLSEGFSALMADEKKVFLEMIWPVAGKLCVELGLWGAPVGKPVAKKATTPIDALKAAVKPATKSKNTA